MKSIAPETLYPNWNAVPGKPSLTAPFLNGNPHEYEVNWLCRVAQCTGAVNAFEIGTFNGITAMHLGHAVPGTTWTLDIPEGVTPKYPLSEFDLQWLALRGEIRAFVPRPANVEQLWGDSATFDYSDYEGRCGLVFVMGSHTPAYVRNDLKVAARLVSQPGVIVWHYGNEAEIPAGIDEEFELTRLGDSRLVIVGAQTASKTLKMKGGDANVRNA